MIVYNLLIVANLLGHNIVFSVHSAIHHGFGNGLTPQHVCACPQVKTWIFNVIFRGLFCVQSVKMSDGVDRGGREAGVGGVGTGML